MKILTIKTSAEFKKISQTQQKFFSKSLVLLTLKSPATANKKINKPNQENSDNFKFCRIGYTVAKTVSKLAVKRNLVKRQLREIFKKLAPSYAKEGFDYVIIARKEILDNDFDKIFSDLKFCLSRIHNAAPQHQKHFKKPDNSKRKETGISNE